MDKAKKYNILFKIIIRQGKFLMLAFGIVCILIYTNYDGDNQSNKPLIELVGQIGGILVSTVSIAFFYDKYKDQQFKNEMETYINQQCGNFIQQNDKIIEKWTKKNRNETHNHITLLSKGIHEKVYVEYLDKEFIDIVSRKELEESGRYRFSAMAEKMIEEDDEHKQNYPVLIYGSTLGIFNCYTDDGKSNIDVLVKAINAGVHFKLALNMPEMIKTNNKIEDRKKKETIEKVLEGLETIQGKILKNAKGSVDLRLLPSVERNSFSSFICKGRRVCVLDFNFENNKISQIFDENVLKAPDPYDLAIPLIDYYMTAHQKGIPHIFVNKQEINRIFVIAIQGKRILMGSSEDASLFPSIEISQNVDIDELIKEKFHELTECDIQLCEFISPVKGTSDDQYYIIGRVNEPQKLSCIDPVYKWKDLYERKGKKTQLALLPISDDYRNRIKFLLSCYGIERTIG